MLLPVVQAKTKDWFKELLRVIFSYRKELSSHKAFPLITVSPNLLQRFIGFLSFKALSLSSQTSVIAQCIEFHTRFLKSSLYFKIVQWFISLGVCIGFTWQGWGWGRGCRRCCYEKRPVAAPIWDRASSCWHQNRPIAAQSCTAAGREE